MKGVDAGVNVVVTVESRDPQLSTLYRTQQSNSNNEIRILPGRPPSGPQILHVRSGPKDLQAEPIR